MGEARMSLSRTDAARRVAGTDRIGRPPWRLAALDVAGLLLVVATILQVADPDVLLHVVWIVLALEAFIFGLRIASARIVMASLFVVTYAFVASGDASPTAAAMIDLDLEEWPLMAVIAFLVAIMADRVTNTGRRYAALYREASDRLLTAQEDERRRLAVDLHDGVGQTLTALTLTLDAADASLAGEASRDTRSRQQVRRARELAALAVDEVRAVAFRLRPPRLKEAGLVAAVHELAASAGVEVDFVADPSLARPGLLDPEHEVDVYRIVQEALGNASRHGRPNRVLIAITQIDRRLRIEIADDGVGFDSAGTQEGGLGLASMRERAASVQGTLRVQSVPGTGTVVRLEVPLTDTVTASLAQDRSAARAGATAQ
jgi:signal transduction histidine kinase